MSKKIDLWCSRSGITPQIKKIDRHLIKCLSELMPEKDQLFWLVGVKGTQIIRIPLTGRFFPSSVDWECLGVLEKYNQELILYKM